MSVRISFVWTTALLALWILGGGAALAQTPIRVRTATELQGAFSRVPEGGVIELAAGTYRAPANGFSVGNLRKSFTVRAAAGATVVLDGEGTRPILRFKNRNRGQNKAIVFQGLTFANGLSTTNNDAGGVSIAAAEARFVSCIFRNNRTDAPSTGGGAVKIYDGSLVSFVGCEFRDNSSKNRGGGLSTRHSTVYVYGTLFAGNRVNLPGHVQGAAGGGIYVLDGTLRVSDSRFEANQAAWVGGAIYAFGTWTEPLTTPRADVTVTRSTFSDNLAVSDACCPPPGPTTGGALHAEDQATLRVFQSVFLRNQAEFGGAINLYRSVAEIGGSIFQANQATLTGPGLGVGGAILALSNDGPTDAVNRRSTQLTLSDSFLQGRPGSAAAHAGGCLMVAGDDSRQYGEDGVAQAGTLAENRAVARLKNVLFSDCDVETSATGEGGVGGAIEGDLVDLTLEDSLILDSDARGAGNRGGMGGGISLQYESDARIHRATLARNSAQRMGGALFVGGSAIRVSQSNFLYNEVAPGVFESLADSRGAAIFTIPLLSTQNPARARDVTGVVSDSVFSDNPGLAIWEVDPESGPINAVRYDGNRFYAPHFGDLVYTNTLADPGRRGMGVGELNSLTIFRGGRPSTRKSEVFNQLLHSPPAVGTALAAPSTLEAGAPGARARASLGFAWTGGGASLAGQPVAERVGLRPVAAPGDFSLVVNGTPVSLARVGPSACTAGSILCLQNGRFRVEAQWRDPAGSPGIGRAAPISETAGTFWYFDPANVELAVKVVDNRASNGHFSVSLAGLSSLEVVVTVLDTVTGRVKTYASPAGKLASLVDPRAFPVAAPTTSRATSIEDTDADLVSEPAPACAVGPGQLCLAGGRIRAELSWRNPRTGRTEVAKAAPLTDSAGYFWFTSSGNPELVAKIVDGRALNQHFWVFAGALTSQQYALTVTNTETGRKKVYRNPAGRLQSFGDTIALRE